MTDIDSGPLGSVVLRIPLMASPCRVNEAKPQIEAAVDDWAVRTGLMGGPCAADGLRPARYGWMAAHTFSEASVADAVLFGKWYAWGFAVDDLLDDGPGRADEGNADRLHRRLSAVLEAPGRLPADASAVERTLAELWPQTIARAGTGWTQRFMHQLHLHRAACDQEIHHRRTGTFPALGQYARLRREANIPFLFELPEVVLGCPVPPAVRATTVWQTLVNGSNDVTGWCNDVISVDRDQAAGDPLNFVLTAAHAKNLTPPQATQWVCEQAVQRCGELQDAARALPDLCARLGLSRPVEGNLSRVACALLAFPRVYLDWTVASGRYAQPSSIRA